MNLDFLGLSDVSPEGDHLDCLGVGGLGLGNVLLGDHVVEVALVSVLVNKVLVVDGVDGVERIGDIVVLGTKDALFSNISVTKRLVGTLGILLPCLFELHVLDGDGDGGEHVTCGPQEVEEAAEQKRHAQGVLRGGGLI